MLNIGKMPIIILVAIGVLSPILESILPLGAVLLTLLPFVILWVGYIAAKAKMSLVEAGVTGALVVLIPGLINHFMGLLYVITTSGSGSDTLAYLLVSSILLSGLIVGVIIGFVLGAIGGFIGQKF